MVFLLRLDTLDTLRIPQTELEEFFLTLDTLNIQDSIKTSLISDLEAEIILYSKLAQQDSLIIAYKNKEIEVDLIKYKKKQFGVTLSDCTDK